MDSKQRRASTRSRVWSDTRAVISFADPTQPDKRSSVSLKGKVRDIGSNGMFLEVREHVAANTDLHIEIFFDPGSHVSSLPIKARGKIVHSKKDGVGIRFTAIDLSRLQKCIVEKMNRVERESKSVYTLGSAGSGNKK